MRRSTIVLLVAAFLAALSAPAAGAAKPHAGPTAAARALARANFAPFRQRQAREDRIAATLLTAAQRTRLRGADTRRIAVGRGWAVYLALEPRHAELLAVGKGLTTDGPPARTTLRQVVAGGAWTTFTPKGGERTTVAVVPDAAVDARLFSTDDAAPTPLEFSGNRIVVRTPGSATISWRRAKGRWISLGVGLGEKAGTPVTATLLDGSHVTVDLGNGVVRTIPIGGAVYGFIPGGYQLSRDNTITLTKGTISVAPTALLTDGCANPPIASTIAATNVTLDPARPSSALLNRDGTVTANLNAILHAILALRQANGCGAPTVPSGLADTPLALALSGTIQRGTGLTNLRLVSAPTPVTLQACLTPGDPSQGCLQPAAVPATMTADVAVKVQVG